MICYRCGDGELGRGPGQEGVPSSCLGWCRRSRRREVMLELSLAKMSRQSPLDKAQGGFRHLRVDVFVLFFNYHNRK